MRTLSAKTTAATGQTITQPRYLVQLGFSTTLYLSTLGGVTWNGISWVESAVQVGRFSQDRSGSLRGELVLPNEDGLFGAIVLGEDTRDASVKVWQLYGDAPYAYEDAVMLFDGVMGAIREVGDTIPVTVTSVGIATARSPRIALSTWLGDDMPVPGTVIRWGSETLTLVAQNG